MKFSQWILIMNGFPCAIYIIQKRRFSALTWYVAHDNTLKIEAIGGV